MSRFFVTPDQSSESPIGDLTGYVLRVRDVKMSPTGGVFFLIETEFRVDGKCQGTSYTPIAIPKESWPAHAPTNLEVITAQIEFFLQTAAVLLTSGTPASLLLAIIGGVFQAHSEMELVIESESGEPYRCEKFRYNDRPIARAEFAKKSTDKKRVVVINGELSEWTNEDL